MTFGSGDNTFNMEFVTVGNAGNAADTSGAPNPAGAVAYDYQMGKYEVSRGMINAYNAVFGTPYSQVITMQTVHGDNNAAEAAAGISWNEAARFVNWLNTSQGFQAAYKFTTDGVNDDISLWSSAEASQLGGENLFRHKNAKYWLPSMDEWYKAAYYDPSTNTYREFPSLDGTEPTAVASGTADNTAVYDNSDSQGPADITQAGGLSAFGIMGLGGNVWEWEETSYDLTNDSPTEDRARRGGGWASTAKFMKSYFRSGFDAGREHDEYGFRVASLSSTAAVPEPSSLVIFASVGLMGLAYRKRRQPKR